MADFYQGRQRGGYFPIILETPNHIVIEGMTHDKATLNPLFLQNLYVNNCNNTMKILTTKYWLKNCPGANSIGDPSTTKNDGGQNLVKNLWKSNYDPTEFYLYLPSSNNYVYRIKTGDLSILNVVGDFVNGAEYNGRQLNGFLFNETAGNIWGTYCGDGSGNNDRYNYDYVSSFVVGKASWTNTGLAGGMGNSCGGYLIQALSKTSTYLFYAVSGPNHNSAGNAYQTPLSSRVYVQTIDLATGTVTTLYDTTACGTWQMQNGPSVPFALSTAPTVKSTYFCTTQASTSFYKIYRFWYDENTPNTNRGTDVCTISYTGTAFTAADHVGITGNRYTLLMRSTVVTDNAGQKFLCMTLTNTANWSTSSTSEPLTSFKTWVFKIGADLKTLTPTQIYQHDDRMYDMIPLNDSHTRVMWIFPNYVAFVVWNNSTSQYEVVNKLSVTARAVGVDDLDRIWLLDYNGKVQLLTPFVPSKVSVTYELSEYAYQGTDINTYINVSAYDAFGARILANVTLTIDGGNCVFADNTTKKTITTSTASDVQVNITVNNSGYFRILANTEV